MRQSLLAAACLLSIASSQPLAERGEDCVQNCFLTGIVGVGATAACGNGNDYISQAICYCQTPGLGDAYSGCLERCPEGGFEKGQHLRDEVCSAANGQQSHGGEHGQDGEQGGKQDPGHHVAGIIYDKVPQAQGNMGDYAGGDYTGGAQGGAQEGAQGGIQGDTKEGAKGGVKEGHDGHKEHEQGHAQEGIQSQSSAAPSQASSASSSSQTFLTPTQTNTKTHSNTSSMTSSASPTSTGFEDDTSSAGSNYQISWVVVLASSAALYFLS
ncbi:hypothetical protein E3Q22_01522 [Wallemia mellicola]|uniref:Extracellular membrane protein CFEM domain-containing protein n=2 Tax=Wallemia mellicola TaxID=1708541 RepID=A0A4T0Q5D0_9BASI|nr:hypothetical protein WALSEDRAFT_65675 [Wallemia mellicola CBS 633.66]TIB72999.1 hypothetical protein E3Q24_01387 [Wallemia mellicola]EIM20092.1 hypothetical protein WALSEDRAFT_65675 [Wallemia mellicola CBS 633.66]TIB77709.1 hypothetical protein E3Q23_01184 [Wallemia mellicola]TIB81006.1 hypothetical protein E3Q22_01522 [Wallemia mellicola]TIB92941.1 hypothetical protein E3Q19_01695 [Wallemia mellicola]|eukprot:XP_006959813.1 hypothetical protein WALSEDRAFT_65675 [Wallemia mellicola CBS 633.66]